MRKRIPIEAPLPLPVLVLMKDHPGAEPSDAVCVSEDINEIMVAAITEELATDMHGLRDIGESVELNNGDELRIEQTKLI